MSDEKLAFQISATDLASAKFAGVNKNLAGMHGASVKASGGLAGLSGSLLAAGRQSLLTGVGLGAGIGAFNLFSTAISGTVGLLGDAVRGAIADEESVNRLAASLRANVPGWDGNTKAIEANIEAKQRLGFSDEELRDSLTVLAGATHDVGRAQEIQNTAMDLARFKGIDLRTASEALIKVEGGHYRSLAQLGIKLRDGATSTEALAAVQKVAAGQAEAYGDTTAGAMEAAGIAFDELKEDIGKELMPVMRDLAKFARDDLIPAIKSAIPVVKDVAGVVGDLGRLAIPLLVGALGVKLVGAFKAAQVAGVESAGAIKLAWGVALLGIPILLEEFRGKSQKVLESNRSDLSKLIDMYGLFPDPVKSSLGEVSAAMAAETARWTGNVKSFTHSAVDEMDDVVPQMADAMLADQFVLTDATTQLVEFMKQALSPAQQAFQAQAFLSSQAFKDGMNSGIPSVVKKTEELRDQATAVLLDTGWASTGGGNVGAAWVAAMNYSLSLGLVTTTTTLNGFKDVMYGWSPPKKGPLKNIDKGAFNIGKAWKDNFNKGLGIGPLNLPTLPSGLGPGGTSGTFGLTTAGAASGGPVAAAGGAPVVIQLQVDGRTLAEIVERHLYYSGPRGPSVLPRGS